MFATEDIKSRYRIYVLKQLLIRRTVRLMTIWTVTTTGTIMITLRDDDDVDDDETSIKACLMR